MGTKERRERERHELRGKILDAAREMFAEEGYEAVTMRALAKRIEYSPTAIYLHFKDKEALINELCAKDLKILHESIFAIAETYRDPAERMKASSRAFVEFALAHPSQYRVVFMMAKPRAEDASPYDAAYAFLREYFVAMNGAGLLKPEFSDPDLTAQAYFCGLHGIVAIALVSQDCSPVGWRGPLEQSSFFIDALLRGLLK